jgi:AraC family transcriptional regulator
MRRVQKSGDIDIVPAGMDGSWEDDADCQILRLSLHPSLLHQVAESLGRDISKIELLPRLQVRDVRIEAIGWAVKADLEAVAPSDPLYIDLLASALAVRLIETASGSSPEPESRREPKLSSRQLRTLTEFVETNLHQKLRLTELAKVAGVGVTRLKTLFRNSTGVPVHQYVIRRRVEYARALIATSAMPASEVAAAAGFAHQSHMASTMRRLLGQSPGDIVRQSEEFRPICKNQPEDRVLKISAAPNIHDMEIPQHREEIAIDVVERREIAAAGRDVEERVVNEVLGGLPIPPTIWRAHAKRRE